MFSTADSAALPIPRLSLNNHHRVAEASKDDLGVWLKWRVTKGQIIFLVSRPSLLTCPSVSEDSPRASGGVVEVVTDAKMNTNMKKQCSIHRIHWQRCQQSLWLRQQVVNASKRRISRCVVHEWKEKLRQKSWANPLWFLPRSCLKTAYVSLTLHHTYVYVFQNKSILLWSSLHMLGCSQQESSAIKSGSGINLSRRPY